MKRILLMIIALFTLIGAQITDDSILNIDYLKFGQKLLSVPDEYTEYRESGNVVLYDSKIIWTTTAVKKVDGNNVYSIHLYVDWKFVKELKLVGMGGVRREAEDPYL